MYEFSVFSFFSSYINKKRLSISNCTVALLYIKLTRYRNVNKYLELPQSVPMPESDPLESVAYL